MWGFVLFGELLGVSRDEVDELLHCEAEKCSEGKDH